ncbi:DNA-3-methyladenine glycosylase 1, partial [Neolecta irregularis DAH-3]
MEKSSAPLIKFPLLTIPSSLETIVHGPALSEGIAHLISVDPRFKVLAEKHTCPLFAEYDRNITPFPDIVRGILAQQVSGAAARSILNRFVNLFSSGSDSSMNTGAILVDDQGTRETSTAEARKNVFPTPEMVLEKDTSTLRSAGLSLRKAEYVSGLANHFVDGTLSAELLSNGTDLEITERLVAVRGIGEWSAHMYLIFTLQRPDIFPVGDLGIQRGMAAWVGHDIAKLKNKGKGKWKYLSEKEMLEISDPWKPWRSLAS